MGFYQNAVISAIGSVGTGAAIGKRLREASNEQKFMDLGYKAEIAEKENKVLSDEIDPKVIKSFAQSEVDINEARNKLAQLDLKKDEKEYKEQKSALDREFSKLYNAEKEYFMGLDKLESVKSILAKKDTENITYSTIRQAKMANDEIIKNYEDLKLKRQYAQDTSGITDAMIFAGLLGGKR